MRSFRLRWFPLGSYPRYRNVPGSPVQVALQYLNGCGLSRAVGSQEGKDLPRGNLQVYAPHGFHRPVGLAKAANLNGKGVGACEVLVVKAGVMLREDGRPCPAHAGGNCRPGGLGSNLQADVRVHHLDRRCYCFAVITPCIVYAAAIH